ncbi:MAG: hypothetical protein R3C68_14870 [Myxococcota bacterium]
MKSDKLDDSSAAFTDLVRAFHESPTQPELRRELEDLAGKAKRWDVLAEAYDAALTVVQEPSEQAPIRRRLAEILDRELGRGAEAVAHYQAAGAGGLPDDLESLESMELVACSGAIRGTGRCS